MIGLRGADRAGFRTLRASDAGPHDLEPERAGERSGLDETDLDRVAQPKRFLGPRPDHGPVRLLEAEIFVAQGSRRA